MTSCTLQAAAHLALEDRALADTRALLTRWGRWVMDGRQLPAGPLGVLGVRKAPPSASITDDAALRVDRAVAQLALRHPRTRMAVLLYYTQTHMTHAHLGKALRCGKGTAQRLLSSGEHWIDAYLHDHDVD